MYYFYCFYTDNNHHHCVSSYGAKIRNNSQTDTDECSQICQYRPAGTKSNGGNSNKISFSPNGLTMGIKNRQRSTLLLIFVTTISLVTSQFVGIQMRYINMRSKRSKVDNSGFVYSNIVLIFAANWWDNVLLLTCCCLFVFLLTKQM